MHTSKLIVASLAISSLLGCSDVTGPSEVGLPRPRDAGSIVFLVQDQATAPVPAASVFVTVPNDVGSVFQIGRVADANGRAEFGREIPAGTRSFDVRPPAGYSPPLLPTSGQVEVGENQAVTVIVTLVQFPR